MIGSLKTVAGTSVTYRRGSDTVPITALVGNTRIELSDEYGGTTVVGSVRDYIVQASDLVLSATTIEPQPGDQIDETRGTDTYTYEVMHAGADTDHRESDRFGVSWRIHTKLIDDE